jgi:hypothetical protein
VPKAAFAGRTLFRRGRFTDSAGIVRSGHRPPGRPPYAPESRRPCARSVRARAATVPVARYHTFYVAAATAAVLVHNCGGTVDGHSSRCGCADGGDVIPKRGPKPKGTGPHNQKISEVADQVADGDVLAGGQIRPERAFPTPGGFKSARRPDVLVQRPNGTIYGINVGRQAASGAPIKREAEALWDLEGIGIEMHFVPYN